MNNIYYWIGFAVVWLGSLIAFLYVFSYLIKAIGDAIGRKYKFLWVIVEFQIYKKDFKEWVKDKQRHINMQEQLPIHDVSDSFCDLNPDFQQYLIEQGETECKQCGKKLKAK